MKSFYEALYLDRDTEITAVDLGNMIDLSYIKMSSSSWKKKWWNWDFRGTKEYENQ